MKKEDLTTRFLREIAKIKEPITFLGVVRSLRIELLNEDKEAKPFSQLLEEVLYKFKNELSRERERELLRILTKANQAKGDLMPQIDATAAHKEEEEVKVDSTLTPANHSQMFHKDENKQNSGGESNSYRTKNSEASFSDSQM